ncbi:uncharacterized protein IL334_004290 [Kwoniella shivajii]|uniref:TLC domain-containing protein n=1 Tax=Kwoniella shivajii TaxID=564305 RepID=A0ABZ1D0B5_9TREE|nr:hypothetical protein IL334_004290 [Kwoniella shivajii]
MISTIILSGGIYLSFFLAYQAFSPLFESERKRAYVLSSISSFTMTLLSIPLFGSYLLYGLKDTFEYAQGGWMGNWTRFAVVFFATYLFADVSLSFLTIGYVKYPSQVGLLTGWIHHTVYIGMMIYLLNSIQAPTFLVGSIMELPTLDLALSNLFPSIRSDLRFLSTFFTLRIVLHSIILFQCAMPSTRAYMGGSFVPVILLSPALLMHLSWFRGGVIGYMKRNSKSSSQKKATKENVVEDPVIQYAASIDQTTAQLIPPTPDDSPIVTPRTPIQNPILGGMSNLPTLSVPNINIPSLGEIKSNLTTDKLIPGGFRDAVKNRWEEQKERFTARDQGTTGMVQRKPISDTRESSETVVVTEVLVD